MNRYKKVESDVYNIANRLKKIDYRYSVYFDENKKLFFLFENGAPSKSLGKTLDKKSIDDVYKSHIRHKYEIFDGMDRDNELLKKKEEDYISKKSRQELKDFMEYADKKGGNVDFSKANSTFWL